MIAKFLEHTLSAQSQVFFLILGTAIGAGMITLPLLTQGLSLLTLTGMLFVSGTIMYGAASCWIDLSQKYGEKSHLTTYVRSLAPVLEIPTHVMYLLFFWSLLAYYLSTMPSFIEAYFSEAALNHPLVYAALLVFFLEASPVVQGMINQGAVFLMLGLLAVILLITSSGQMSLHIHSAPTQTATIGLLSPLMMFFGYHLSIPSFRVYKLSVKELRNACIKAGLAIGLLYWIWCLVLLSAVGHSGIVLNEKEFLTQLATITQSSAVLHPVAWFSLLAMWTSCLGMSLGTQHYLKDLFVRYRHLPFSLSLLNIFPSIVLLFCTQGAYRQLLSLASFLALYLLVLLPALLLIIQERRQKKTPLKAVALFILSALLMLVTA